MPGETSLDRLLASLSPRLLDEEYVFLSFADARYGDHQALAPIASFHEAEGLTLVVSRDAAERAGLSYQTVLKRITLGVHSSLAAVGLTAAVATRLTEHGISANVIAAFYHDHVFVPSDQAGQALRALQDLSR